MKKSCCYIFSLSLAASLFINLSPLHSAWETQTSGTSNTLHSASISDENTVWVAGNSGTILKSADTGKTWTIQNSSTSNNLRSVFFLDNSSGIVSGNSATIAKTVSAASTWELLTPGLSDTIFYSIAWPNSSTVYVGGELGRVRKSTDSGNSWHNGAPNGSGISGSIKSIYFVNDSTGWAAADSGIILKTTDGGSNWSSTTADLFLRNLNALYFFNESTGIAVGDSGVMLKTTNSGTTWSSVSSTSTTLYSIACASGTSKCWAVGANGSIFKSTNTGDTFAWERSGTTYDLYGIQIYQDQYAVAVGAYGTVLRLSIDESATIALATQEGGMKGYGNIFNPDQNSSTQLEYWIKNSGTVRIRIYTLQGRLIKTLIDSNHTLGSYSVQWDGKNDSGQTVASGIYIAHIAGPNFSQTVKIAVVR